MIPSSSSKLSVKTQHSRPSSSLSSRPPSRNTARPSSSLGLRPSSSASTRPQSRFSVRPNSRQARSRLVPQCQTLVTQITAMREADDADGDPFREAVDYAVKSLETSTIMKASASVDISVIDRRISGIALKARLNSQDVFSDALKTAYEKLKENIAARETDLDQDIKASHLPDHLQLLLELSRPPTDVTIMKARTYLETIANPPYNEPTLAWTDILAEEPFEGDHWEEQEWDSTSPLSPLNSDDDLGLDEDFSSLTYEESSATTRSPSPEPRPEVADTARLPLVPVYELRSHFEELQTKQYWRDNWHTDAIVDPRFDIKDISTLGPTISRVLATASGYKDAQGMLKPDHYIDEDDMTREILMCLQGNNTIILHWEDNAFRMAVNPPRLVHLSLASQESIILSLARIATVVQNLRRFAAAIFTRSSSGKLSSNKRQTTRTLEAFADAVDETIRGLNTWCAAKEEAICRAYAGLDEEPLIISLLSTEHAIREEYGSIFEVLLQIIQKTFQTKTDKDFALFNQPTTQLRQPAVLTAQLLDTLFSSMQQHMERQDTVTSDALMRVFVKTASPIWSMVGKWLKDGMGLGLCVGSGGRSNMADELEDEFFIESSGLGIGMMGVGLLDPEFWQEGYTLRESVLSSEGPDMNATTQTRRIIPLFLEHVADLVLSTGKAVGLMRALGGSILLDAFVNWRFFSDLVCSDAPDLVDAKRQGLFSVSVDTLSRLVYDTLLPDCRVTAERLVKVLLEDCFLWKHLSSIEGLFFMNKGDAMSHFIDVLFAKMDSMQPWGDFYFLNTAFSDIIEANQSAGDKEWIKPSLVRLLYRGNREKDRSIKRTVKAMDGLLVEYAVPFPLTYIFQPKTIQGYNDVFVFLLQIRRAKSVLDRILLRDEKGKGKQIRQELKAFYAMRSRLSWFINTLYNFVTTYVIHAETLRFHDIFRQATSLDEMICLHDEHLEKVRGRCLLKPNTSALHRAIISILDMCLHFGEGFITFAGDTTTALDLSHQSKIMKGHRSRRQRRQRRNTVGFSHIMREDDDSTDEEGEEFADLEGGTPGDDSADPSFSVIDSSTTADQDEDFPARVGRMSSELDGLVRFLRRGVESLAGGTTEAAPAFGILAFSLEDWDL